MRGPRPSSVGAIGLFLAFGLSAAALTGVAEARPSAEATALVAAVAAPAAASAAAPASTGGVVNVVAASSEELERLPGIGEAKARAIIEHRRTHPLRRLEDLTRVKGIGRKTVLRLRPYLTLSGPTTLRDRPRSR